MRNRSPIERMVDSACGVPDDYTPPPRVTLRCPNCKRTMSAAMEKIDPPGTAVVETCCPNCAGNERREVFYYDKDGKQLLSSDGDNGRKE